MFCHDHVASCGIIPVQFFLLITSIIIFYNDDDDDDDDDLQHKMTLEMI